MDDKIIEMQKLADLIAYKNDIDGKVASIIKRPALIGHAGEYIASRILNVNLAESAAHKGSDGIFTQGVLCGKTVNIKWHTNHERILDINPNALPDYYLVLTGPLKNPSTSRLTTRPWTIDYVFLFNASKLIETLKSRGVKIGIATSVAMQLWEKVQIYPDSCNSEYILTEEQKYLFSLFKKANQGSTSS